MITGRNDLITRDVIRQLLPAIADEMALDLQRSSYNMMIYEVRDFCCALLARDGSLLCQNIGGVSHFVADLGVVIKDGIERYGIDGFGPDDGYITNHQRVAGQHLNNIVTYRPVFAAGELVCFAVVRAHWIDVGGMSTGFGAGPQMADPWQEGLQLDQIRLYNRGVVDEQILRMIGDNIRFPDSSFGDMRAQFAACRLGDERISELVDRYGIDTFHDAVEALYDDSEARCRRVIAEIPDGEYFAESVIDHDYVDREHPVEIKVRVLVEGSDMTIDLTGCSLERKGGINARTLAAPYIAYKSLTTPNEPVNEGSFRALKVDIQDGNFMMARFPAPMSSWSMALTLVVDTIYKALAPALPHRIPGGHGGFSGGPVFINPNPQKGHASVVQSVEGGGWGGRPWEDGESASVMVIQGDVRNAPIETLELRSPLVMLRRALRQDSGGAGQYRGGLGLEIEVTNLADGIFTSSATPRHACPPWGLYGGAPGEPKRSFVASGPGDELKEVDQIRRAPVKAGGRVRITTAGGGGWGNPLERLVDSVLADVTDEYVSLDSARDDYGVVFESNPLSVNKDATEALRHKIAAERGTKKGDSNG